MISLRRLSEAVHHLYTILGAPGLMIGVFSLASFAFGLLVLTQESRQPRQPVRSTVNVILADWIRSPDYLGLTLVDYSDLWNAASPDQRNDRRVLLTRALERLGQDLERQNEKFPLIHVIVLRLTSPGLESLAVWRSPLVSENADTDVVDTFPILDGSPREAAPVRLEVRYRVAPGFEATQRGMEISYQRLLLALVGFSGFSLLCLGYMILHAQALSERVAREAAQEATLDLADRTCHELGNGVFVLANERRNLAEHLDLVERFLDASPAALDAAAKRAGLDAEQSARWKHALHREYAARGIDPEIELRGSAAMARRVCEQIDVCSDYIGLTVHELDTFLKRSSLPVSLDRVSIHECLDEALALLRPRLEASDAQIQRKDDAQAIARADRRLLIHALVNLIKNAVEAVEHATPVITLSTRREGRVLWIVVADNGPGLPAEARRRLFRETYSTKGPGRGRGLGIVRESVALQHGEIRNLNVPTGGAVWEIGLPVVEDADARVNAPPDR